MNVIRVYSGLLLGMVTLAACSKLKEDQRTGNLPTDAQMTASTVRLVNVAGFTDLIINGQKLTNFVLPTADGTRYPSPTVYFPTTGTIGSTYSIPEPFLNGNDSATVQIEGAYDSGNGVYVFSGPTFGVKETYNTPTDYYWVLSRAAGATGGSTGYDSLVVIPRAVSPAADPTHILVRLVNLSSAPDDAGLTGPMSLAFADGQHVSPSTDGIAPHNWSGYVELSYGSYQFKVLTDQNAQVPGVPVNLLTPILVTDQFTTVMSGMGLTYAPIQTFQPGGVYTIVVSVNNGYQYSYGGSGGSIGDQYNSYRIITDVNPPVNGTYSRLQAANAVPGTPLTVLVDGTPLASGLAYDSASAYQAYVTGTHKVSVQDAGGKELASKSVDILSNTNFTIWTFPSGSGVDFLMAENNLGGNRNDTYNTDGSDPSSGTTYNSFPFLVRFLNFCPDLPYATFTQANGALFVDGSAGVALAAQNLPFGGQLSSALVPYPYASSYGSVGLGGLGQIQVYQSQPSLVPGNWLSTIPSLQTTDFITMPASFYPAGLPGFGEPGVYTVALTGRYGPDAPAGQEARLIVLKHTK
jgi:hypothetical protein